MFKRKSWFYQGNEFYAIRDMFDDCLYCCYSREFSLRLKYGIVTLMQSKISYWVNYKIVRVFDLMQILCCRRHLHILEQQRSPLWPSRRQLGWAAIRTSPGSAATRISTTETEVTANVRVSKPWRHHRRRRILIKQSRKLSQSLTMKAKCWVSNLLL